MDEELMQRIKLLKRRAILCFLCFLSFIILLPLSGIFLFDADARFLGIILLAVSAVIIAVFVRLIIAYKKDAETYDAKPCVLCAHSGIKYDDLIKRFENLSIKGNRLCLSDDLQFFRFKKKLYVTAIIYRTDSFSKNQFDSAKKRINRKANKEFNITHIVTNQSKVNKSVHLNIICLDSMNSEAISLLSMNAEHNLRRAEALMNIAVVGNKIIIPPIYGDCYYSIVKYDKIANFIMENIVT